MTWRVDLSTEAQEQLVRFPRDARERLKRAIDEFETKDESQWSNIKALHGPAWKGRLRKKLGPYRIIFRKFPDRGVLEISAILIKSKDTYR
jgi:mRNA-degrading endonuclease RelE of RelBE toxin-antitoxin system